MWMLIGNLIKKKWRQRSKAYLMEFERSGEKAIEYDKNHSESDSRLIDDGWLVG